MLTMYKALDLVLEPQNKNKMTLDFINLIFYYVVILFFFSYFL